MEVALKLSTIIKVSSLRERRKRLCFRKRSSSESCGRSSAKSMSVMENRGRVVTKAMLLEQLWDIDGNFVDDNTVRVNIKRLRQKLHDEKQEYIVTVFGMGYTFGE